MNSDTTMDENIRCPLISFVFCCGFFLRKSYLRWWWLWRNTFIPNSKFSYFGWYSSKVLLILNIFGPIYNYAMWETFCLKMLEIFQFSAFVSVITHHCSIETKLIIIIKVLVAFHHIRMRLPT